MFDFIRKSSIAISEFKTMQKLALIFYFYMCYEVIGWFVVISDPTSQQVTFASIIVSSAPGWFALYNSATPSAFKKVEPIKQSRPKTSKLDNGDYDDI